MAKAPFIYGKVAADDNFTNRKEELVLLKQNFSAHINTILISPRRWGKTSLVKKATDDYLKEQQEVRACRMDMFTIRTEQEFYVALADKVLKATASKAEQLVRNAKEFLSHLIPKIEFSPDRQTSLSFGIDFEEIQKNPDDILDLAEHIAARQNKELLICIDEFQNITNFNAPKIFQQKLRAHWQNHQHVTYCLYGSKRHMLLDIFSNPAMPFYKFGELMLLEKIRAEDWLPFIRNQFSKSGKKINEKLAYCIIELADYHPYYVQQLAQQCWFRTHRICQERAVYQAHEAIISQLSLLFTRLTEGLSTPELNLLKAIGDGEKQLTAKRVLSRYGLSSSANAVRLQKKLLTLEIIDREGAGQFSFMDPFYEYWLKTRYWDSE